MGVPQDVEGRQMPAHPQVAGRCHRGVELQGVVGGLLGVPPYLGVAQDPWAVAPSDPVEPRMNPAARSQSLNRHMHHISCGR
jgi:hypothetical protein